MGKLKLERNERGDGVVIRKARGRLTFEEVELFMHEPEQVRGFEGVLCVWFFRVRDGMDTPDMYGWEEPQGDCVELYLMDDENACPVCGTGAWVQYCPECGTKLTPRKG